MILQDATQELLDVFRQKASMQTAHVRRTPQPVFVMVVVVMMMRQGVMVGIAVVGVSSVVAVVGVSGRGRHYDIATLRGGTTNRAAVSV